MFSYPFHIAVWLIHCWGWYKCRKAIYSFNWEVTSNFQNFGIDTVLRESSIIILFVYMYHVWTRSNALNIMFTSPGCYATSSLCKCLKLFCEFRHRRKFHSNGKFPFKLNFNLFLSTQYMSDPSSLGMRGFSCCLVVLILESAFYTVSHIDVVATESPVLKSMMVDDVGASSGEHIPLLWVVVTGQCILPQHHSLTMCYHHEGHGPCIWELSDIVEFLLYAIYCSWVG